MSFLQSNQQNKSSSIIYMMLQKYRETKNITLFLGSRVNTVPFAISVLQFSSIYMLKGCKRPHQLQTV